jgi:hypothetical protein
MRFKMLTFTPIKKITDVEMALRNWRRRPVCELPDLASAIRRAAGRGLHLSEKHWRAVHKIESIAREKAAAVSATT